MVTNNAKTSGNGSRQGPNENALQIGSPKSRTGSAVSFSSNISINVFEQSETRDCLPDIPHINPHNPRFLASEERRKSVMYERRMSRLPPRRNRRNEEIGENEEMPDDEVQFSRLQKMFVAAEDAGLTGLSIDEFKNALRSTVGRGWTEDEIELLFMKVDANCDHFVDWEEYVTYNLLEYKEKTLMMEMLREKPFPNEINEIDSRHRDTIIKIVFYPNVRKTGSKEFQIDSKSGKYITLSKEGVLGLWTIGMKNLKYFNANHYQDRHTQPWFTDMVVMHNVNMLAISSTDRDITIFDLSVKKFFMRYYLTGIDDCITSMTYWANPKDLNKALLVWGDMSGSIVALKFETSLRGGPFGAVSGKKNSCKRVSFPEVMKGFVLGVKGTRFPNIHEDWVNTVQYLPDIECFLSSCQSPQTALFFGDFQGKKSNVYFAVNKGVLSFDYSSSLNIIVTGGMDYLLRVWNPYVNTKAIVLLKGHTKPVNHVIINDNKNQVISIDKGRSLRVYDLRDQTCLQQISGRMIKFDPFPISSAYFNPAMRTIILAANQLVMLEKREEEERYAEILSHNKPIVGAIYSNVFNSVVSACQESVVSIWDTNTGDKVMQFVNAHSRMERGVEIPVEITALCFDYNGRRLVTGARNGTVNVWNYNNGSCMQKFTLPDSSDVTGLACTMHRIYVTGWGKAIYVYVDGGGEEHRKAWKIHHKEDILCIAYQSPNIIATGSYDGDVFIWSRETGQVYCCLNAFVDVKPIGEKASHVPHRGHRGSESELDATSNQTIEITNEEDEQTRAAAEKRKNKQSGTIGLGLLSKLRYSFGHDDETTEIDEEKEKCSHPLLTALDTTSARLEEMDEYSRDEYDRVCKNYESAVEKIIFLDAREPLNSATATIVTSGAEGWIRLWSMHHEGGLLGQFNASHRLGESVLALTSDATNQYLITGDTQGYVKVWSIKEYCNRKKLSRTDRQVYIEFLRQKFTFYRVETYEVTKYTDSIPSHLQNTFSSRPPPASSDPKRTLKYPPLVNSFRAHTRSINSVEYVTAREILITASADCSVRMWTINGQYIGTFGGERWKPLPPVMTTDYFLSQIPTDIRRTGSAKTLKVMNAGKTPLWHSAFKLIRQRGIERLKKQFGHLQPIDEVVTLAQDAELQTSNILGKSYKTKVRHKLPPTLPKFIETHGSVAVYHALPFVDLTPVEGLTQTMRDIQARRMGISAYKKLKGQNKSKATEIPQILNLYNKVVNKPTGASHWRTRYRGRIKKVANKFQSKSPTKSPVAKKKSNSATHSLSAHEQVPKPPTESGLLLPEIISDGEGDEGSLDRKTSSNLTLSPNMSKVDFKLPSIVE